MELFSGVGGLSLGAVRGGVDLRAAVEFDPIASASHAVNFPDIAHLEDDVATLSGIELLRQAGIEPGGLDVLFGGPPCQGFSSIGKHDATDPRNELFGHFFRLVAETAPMVFVAENVPGILHAGNADLRTSALSRLSEDYVVLPPIILKASDLGAPTTRTRVFFVGFDRTRCVLDLKKEDIAAICDEPVLVKHALEGLPQIRPSWQDEPQSWRGLRSFPIGPFFDRVFGHIPKGVGDPAAIDRLDDEQVVSGCFGTVHTPAVLKRFSGVAPGKTDSISRAPRLHSAGLCPTLRAGTGSERGSFQSLRPIHPTCHRVITPREAARLQGFPDWFQFHSTKWHSFRQIGNSVSPIVGEALFSAIRRKLQVIEPHACTKENVGSRRRNCP